MLFKTNVLNGRQLVSRMIEDGNIEKLRLESKLGLNTVSEHRSTRSEENATAEKAALQAKLARAEADMEAAPVGSRDKRRAEIARNKIQAELDEIAFEEEGDDSDPRNIVDALLSQARTKALLDVQVAYVGELQDRLAQLPA